MLLAEVRAWCARQGLFAPGELVLAACSGGPDSLALVHLLQRLGEERGFSLAVAHVDHCFRGEASAADARFVAAYCAGRGLLCVQTAIDVPAHLERHGGSPQDAARQLRYAWLRAEARCLGASCLATGHHGDDQAETVLLHLLRGAGAEGLAAMAPREGLLVRPLLAVRRQQIEAYCRQHGLQPRQDESNRKDVYRRNHLRHRLLPALARYNPEVVAALGRTAQIVRQEHDFVRSQALAELEACAQDEGEGLLVAVPSLVRCHPAVQREVWRQALEKKRGSLKGICFVHVESLMELAKAGRPGAKVELPGGWQAVRDYRTIRLGPAGAERRQAPGGAWQAPLQTPGVTPLPDGRCLRASWEPLSEAEGPVLALAWERLAPPLAVRFRQAGDAFRPRGLGGRKKLKEFFIDAKLSRGRRDAVPLVCDREGILWVTGLRSDERAAGAGRQLYVRLEEHFK